MRDNARRRQLDSQDPEVQYPKVMDLREIAPGRGWDLRELLPASVHECAGSRAVSEDALLWARDGARLLREHRDWRKNPKLTERWYAFLHAKRRYPVCGVFTCTVPKATVISRGGAVISPEGEWLQESHFISWPPRQSELPSDPLPVLPGKFVSLLTVWGDTNFSHFVLDALLRVSVLGDLAGYRFLVPAELKPWHIGFLEAVGISRVQLVPAATLLTRVEELVVCRIAAEGIVPRQELLRQFRDRILSHLKVEPLQKLRRIFIERAGVKRTLKNLPELKPILAEHGFEIVCSENLTTAEQIRLFAGAEVVAGMHGSGFLNTIFAPAGAKLLEIYNPVWWDSSILRYTALCGHEHWHCFGENVSEDNDTTLDPAHLKRVLDYMLGGESIDPPPN